MTALLLPGLDGTATLFAPFVAAAPSRFAVQPLALPNDRQRSYPQLTDWVLDRLPAEPFAIIAESFSGPLALLVADRCPRVIAVVLCASFVAPPRSRFLAHVPDFVWSRPPPPAFLRFFMTGGDETIATLVRDAVADVPPEVLADRVASVLSADATAELERFTRPLLVLRATRDRMIPARSFARMRATNPSASFAEIDAPHLLLQTRPHEAWSVIARFLDAL